MVEVGHPVVKLIDLGMYQQLDGQLMDDELRCASPDPWPCGAACCLLCLCIAGQKGCCKCLGWAGGRLHASRTAHLQLLPLLPLLSLGHSSLTAACLPAPLPPPTPLLPGCWATSWPRRSRS